MHANVTDSSAATLSTTTDKKAAKKADTSVNNLGTLKNVYMYNVLTTNDSQRKFEAESRRHYEHSKRAYFLVCISVRYHWNNLVFICILRRGAKM